MPFLLPDAQREKVSSPAVPNDENAFLAEAEEIRNEIAVKIPTIEKLFEK